MLAVLNVLLPIFALILAGYLCRRTGCLGETAASELNRFVVWLCLPALLFHTTATATLDEIWHPGFIAVISIGSLAVFFATLLYRLRGRELADASIDGLSAAYANTGYIGIPLCVLVLGDDDLVSLALVDFTDKLQVDVLELDTDLVAFLKEKGGDRLTVLEHNLRHGVPDSMKDCYDAVTTDPPYADDGMRFFLECAKVSLKDRPESRLFLTTYPGLLESPDMFWTDLEELGLEILHTHHHFSRYIYNNSYRVQHLAALRYLGSPIHPTTELLGFPFLYAHFFECKR